MRPLTEDELRLILEKLGTFIGPNVKQLIDRPDGSYCFRLQKDRVYYVYESLMKNATNVARSNLASLGTCFGKFTHHGRFHLHVSCLEYLAQYAKVCRFNSCFSAFYLHLSASNICIRGVAFSLPTA